MNGLSNAVKHTPHGETDGITLTARLDGALTLQVEVCDRGPGLRGQTMEQLKTEFGGDGRAQQRTGTGIRSSGLGFPICVRLAEMMGGSVTLADRGDGPGARFTLRLPLVAAHTLPSTPPGQPARRAASAPTARQPSVLSARVAPVGATANAEASPGRVTSSRVIDIRTSGSGVVIASAPPSGSCADISGVRALVVDDSAANLRFAAFVLKRLGCAVVTATDGDEVLNAVAAAASTGTPIDVVLMDLFMARVNGDAALAALRAAGHALLPVVLCTANATCADVARYRALGFVGQLGKPFTPEQMHAAVSAALGR